MALDSDGRPIPVSTPTPPQMPQPPMAQPPEEMAQAQLNMKKTDDALRQIADLSQRVNQVERSVDERVNAAIIDFGKRFDAMMLARMQDLEKRFEMLASIVSIHSAQPHDHLPGPAPTPGPT